MTEIDAKAETADTTAEPRDDAAQPAASPASGSGSLFDSLGAVIVFGVILAVFGLFAAYETWTAVQNLITVPPLVSKNYDFYRENGLDGLVKPLPWVQLVVAVAAPAVTFVAAILAGRRRPVALRVALLVVAACAASAVLGSVNAYVTSTFQI